jgi:hypothetical protein
MVGTHLHKHKTFLFYKKIFYIFALQPNFNTPLKVRSPISKCGLEVGSMFSK